MTWGRTLENAPKSKGISKDFDEWIAIAKDRSKWRQLTHSIPKPPDAASGAEKLFLVFVGLCSFVFAQPTALQPRDPSFVSKKEDRRC